MERDFWKAVTQDPPLYGADTPVSFFRKTLPWGWNLRSLGCLLSQCCVPDIPGVTSPMTYFGMWKVSWPPMLLHVDSHASASPLWALLRWLRDGLQVGRRPQGPTVILGSQEEPGPPFACCTVEAKVLLQPATVIPIMPCPRQSGATALSVVPETSSLPSLNPGCCSETSGAPGACFLSCLPARSILFPQHASGRWAAVCCRRSSVGMWRMWTC